MWPARSPTASFWLPPEASPRPIRRPRRTSPPAASLMSSGRLEWISTPSRFMSMAPRSAPICPSSAAARAWVSSPPAASVGLPRTGLDSSVRIPQPFAQVRVLLGDRQFTRLTALRRRPLANRWFPIRLTHRHLDPMNRVGEWPVSLTVFGSLPEGIVGNVTSRRTS